MRGEDEETQVSCTLLEYGRRHGLSQQYLKASRGKGERDKARAAIAASLGGAEEGEDEAEEVSGSGWEERRGGWCQHCKDFTCLLCVCVCVCLCLCDSVEWSLSSPRAWHALLAEANQCSNAGHGGYTEEGGDGDSWRKGE